MKRKADRTTILKIELGIFIVATIISVTIAWFVRMNTASVKGIDAKASSSDYIKVALESGGKDVLELTGSDALVKINMPEFYDTEANKLAPGVYGKMDLYITSLNPGVDKCSLTMDYLPEYIDNIAIAAKEEIYNLLKGHIQFYSKKDNTGYTGLITDDAPLKVNLEYQTEIPVTIYWVWFYEYSDIPPEGLCFNPENYFDKDKYIENGDYVYYYDCGDTKIGTGVKNLEFQIKVDTLNLDGE